ncbi:uncharacterized protein LOC110443547 [Mizuhopecten yessoensis]|uniref:Uncharacterized protein n=1 Tax=Mizuhopecten yessoensis TaxID=6573 RepID=A0A210PEQ6_MIZYE|nr:uncharacterized protein LOC110443547 [Mizuhopecten yessoensis]OWF34964.1 hypothetical protein KP79_PYT23553 [Mizuhopecten yessoensis]
MATSENMLTSLLAVMLMASVDGLLVNEADVLDRNDFRGYEDDLLGPVGYGGHSEVEPHYNMAQGDLKTPQRFPSPLMNTLLWRMSVESDDNTCPEEQPILVSVNGLNGKFLVCASLQEASHMRSRRGVERSRISSKTSLSELKSNSANQKRSRLSINGALTSLAGMLQSNARRHGGNNMGGVGRDLLLKKILSIG